MNHTIKQVLAAAKKAGYSVTKASAKVNGQSAYKVQGLVGLHTKAGLVEFLGL